MQVSKVCSALLYVLGETYKGQAHFNHTLCHMFRIICLKTGLCINASKVQVPTCAHNNQDKYPSGFLSHLIFFKNRLHSLKSDINEKIKIMIITYMFHLQCVHMPEVKKSEDNKRVSWNILMT